MYIHVMRLLKIVSTLSFLCVFAFAQAPAPGPTTHVLAIGHIVTGTAREKLTPIMQQEVSDTVHLYLAGKIEQWFSRRDQRGVVFLLNVATVAEAKELLEKLPLGQAKLMEFDLIPVGPLGPLGILAPESPVPPR